MVESTSMAESKEFDDDGVMTVDDVADEVAALVT